MKWAADFETTTDLSDCRVWAWAISAIGDSELCYWGTTIDEFIGFISTTLHNPQLYFHNAKFDFQFIISYLLHHGFLYIEDKKDHAPYTFSTLITDTGQYYALDIWFPPKPHYKNNHVRFYDSLKILNFSVEMIGREFNLPYRKLTLDYTTYRAPDHKLTPHEIDYVLGDVKVMSSALAEMFNRKLDKMTIGSDALSFYKALTPHFNRLFPVLDYEIDHQIRLSYKGGFTYLNPLYQGKETGSGIVFDKNSMYPAKLKHSLLPWGNPTYFEGKYEKDPCMPLYVQNLTCVFELKQGKIPSIQIKKSPYFQQNQYLDSSNGQPVTLTLANPDLELFLTNYDVYGLKYNWGYKFYGRQGMFTRYVDYWTENKIGAKKEGNKALYQISKLLLNSLYGKFGLNPNCASKIPYLDDEGVVRYKTTEAEIRDSIYVPVAAFVTAYARRDIIESSEKIREFTLNKYGFDGYIYSDTDSIHCILAEDDVKELSQTMDIDDYKLGAWKVESKFTRGKFLRQKCYIEEDEEGKINATVAGLPKKLSHLINFENFKLGFTTADFTAEEIGEGKKLTYKYCKGGVVLVETDFTIT